MAGGSIGSPVDLAQLLRGPRRWTIMSHENPDFRPAPGRFPFALTPRLTVVVLNPVDGEVIVGWFLDGELAKMIEDPIGEA